MEKNKSTFDCIIPLGETCNITFLMHNCKLKKETSLFEWFVSENLNSITAVLNKIIDKTDTEIIVHRTAKHIAINDNTIWSGHYTKEEFMPIYLRRRDRLLETIQKNNNILFVRMEGTSIKYTNKDIEAFASAIRRINPTCNGSQLLLISPTQSSLDHPFVIKEVYDGRIQSSDPYCTGHVINTLFTSLLKKVGYNLEDTLDTTFTDRSEL
jgi:hypothetical protein